VFSHQDLEKIANALGKASKNGNGWVCHCPAHNDHNPSLSISLGNDGKLLLHCHAGCSFENVLKEIQARNLLPNVTRNSRKLTKPSSVSDLRSRDDNISLLQDGNPILPIPKEANTSHISIKGKKPTLYPYRNQEGDILFYIARVNSTQDDGSLDKSIFPVCWWMHSDGREAWNFKHPLEENRPLLNLPQIIDHLDKMVIVGEGEKVACAISRLFPHAIATTSCGGSNAAEKTDWSILRGREVILSLDCDQAGEAYGLEVCNLCRQVGAKSVKQIPTELFGQYIIKDNQVVEQKKKLPKGYDLADAFEEGWTVERIKELEAILEQKGLSLVVDFFDTADVTEPQNEYEWPDPRPIKTELLPVEPLPLEIIPEPFQPWIQDIAHRMQCPLEHVAIPVMVMIGSIIGAGCGIRPKQKDNWLIIPNLWGGIIGNPSTLKSPALAEALKPLTHLEKKAREQFEVHKEDHSYSMEAHKIAKETQISKIKNNLKSAKNTPTCIDGIKEQLKNMGEPEQPTCKRFKTNDSTIEKITELLAENPRGLLLSRDELMGLFANWDKAGHEADRTFYLESWNGYGSHTTDRIGRGTTHCDNMCISILGSTQPSKLLSYFHRAINNIENDGLVQRFQMLVYPDEPKTWQLIDKMPNNEAQQSVFQIVEAISVMNFVQHGAIQETQSSIPYFHFNQEAQQLLNKWLTELETIKLRGDECSIIVEHLAKYRKLMPTLALIIHVVDIAARKATGPVSLEAAEKAAAWCDVLESHARRIYGMATNYAMQAAISLSKKLKKHELEDSFTVREVYRKGWSLLSNKEDVQAACDELVEAGWLKEVVTDPAFGQKGKIEYIINPKIWR
jgi:hypothetical protein